MTPEQELLALERGFWTEGPEHYRRHAAEQCLFAFPGMAGLYSNEQAARTVDGPDRWRDVEIVLKGLVRLSDDALVLTYEASAVRAGTPYRALASSAYARRGGQWKLAFHQQTPLEQE